MAPRGIGPELEALLNLVLAGKGCLEPNLSGKAAVHQGNTSEQWKHKEGYRTEFEYWLGSVLLCSTGERPDPVEAAGSKRRMQAPDLGSGIPQTMKTADMAHRHDCAKQEILRHDPHA